jgi:hypothetical protein
MIKQKKSRSILKTLRQSTLWSSVLLCAFVLPLFLQFLHGFLHEHEDETCHHEATEVVDACHLNTHHHGLDVAHECDHKTHIDKKVSKHCELCDLFTHQQTIEIEYPKAYIFLSLKPVFSENTYSFLSTFSQVFEALLRNKSPPVSK